MLTFADFRTDVMAAGLQAVECAGPGADCPHWQIRGGAFLVNFWPQTKRGPRMHVAGTTGSRQATVVNAVVAAHYGLPGTKKGNRHTKPGYYKAVKRRLLARDPHCLLCGCPLDEDTATLDHVIPLSKGGTNGGDNLRLACEPCNSKKANKMPKGRAR